MNCREVRGCLSPYLDSELGKTKTFEVSEHLRTCESCARRFEQERAVERIVCEKLADTPSMDFDSFVQQAIQKKASFIQPWHIGALGVAACLALFTWVAISPGRDKAAPVEDWITARFTQASPNGRAFVPVVDASTDLLGEVRSVLGVSLALKAPKAVFAGHNVEIISVTRRSIEGGAPFVEARLNCCGEPMLLAFIPRVEAEKIGKLPAGVKAGVVHKHPESTLNVATWAARDFVLVAASPHMVDQVAPAFSVIAL